MPAALLLRPLLLRAAAAPAPPLPPVPPGVPLPPSIVGAYTREFKQEGNISTRDYSWNVSYLQTPFLFMDVRVRKDRPPALRAAASLDDYGLDELAQLALQHGSTGGTVWVPPTHKPPSERWPGGLNWHDVLCDFRDLCNDPARALPALINGSHVADDVGYVEKFPPVGGQRMFHEHWNEREDVFEQWRTLSDADTADLALAWPVADGRSTFLASIGGYFSYSRDRAVRGGIGDCDCASSPSGDASGNCSIEAVPGSPLLTLEQKRAYLDSEVSWGRVEGPGRFRVVQSTLPFKEGALVDTAPLCGAPYLSYFSTAVDLRRALGCAP